MHEPEPGQEFKPKSYPPACTPSQVPATATFEAHEPGVNDFMSGGVLTPPTRRRHQHPRRSTIASDDTTVASSTSIFRTVKTMPFKILSLHDLHTLDLFDAHFPTHFFPANFTTTILGVCRAVEDAAHVLQAEKTGRFTWDEAMVGALAKRGGYLPGDKKVEYVEDMVPLWGEEERDCFDGEYWGMVASQGTVWEEIGNVD
jgi:hypothetical protein